jgi:hypothetical protein
MTAVLRMPPDEATVAAYLSHKLPTEQADAFEIYCLEHPQFARKVELDLTFKRGLREIGLRNLQPGPSTRFWPRPALAASVAAVAACGLLLVVGPRWRDSLVVYRSATEVPSALRTDTHFGVTLVHLRGAQPPHRIVAPGRNGVLELRLYPDASPGRQGYSARIAYDSMVRSRSVILTQLRADSAGYIEMYLPLSEVADRTLKITLSPDPDPSGSPPPAFLLQIVTSGG